MDTQLHTECITCGQSIPLGDTFCGEDECLNRYAADNEHPDYSYAQFQTWQQQGGRPVELEYHDWAVAHRELAALENDELIDRHDQDEIDALREQLFFEPRLEAAAPKRYTEANEHPAFSHFNWRQAVAERSTELGYHDWASAEELNPRNSSDAVAARGWLV